MNTFGWFGTWRPLSSNKLGRHKSAPHLRLKSPVLYVTLENGPFWPLKINFLELCRAILVSSCGLKKSHYSRFSLDEAPAKNGMWYEPAADVMDA